jgi:two-component system sensor histidine kinase/response regulator
LAAKPVKRKKARHDNQMSLFGEGRAAAETASAAESHPPSAEPPSPPVTARPAEAEKSAPAEIPEADPARTRPAERPPTSAPTAAELDLPEIDGLNIGDGFSLAHGDPKAYLKSLRHFTESQAGAAEKIRDLLVTGDRATAGQLARRLKSEASDIGAEALQGAAADLEWAIRNQSDPEAIESVWAALDKSLHSLLADLKLALKPKEEKRAPVRPLPPSPPVNLSQLRMAVSEILPLLTGHDPGAKDCLKDNRTPFRSAFSPEGFVEFEQTVKGGDYAEAVQQLKRAARKHGISA